MDKLAARVLGSSMIVFLAGCGNKGSEQVIASGGRVAVSSGDEQAGLKSVNWGRRTPKLV
jgi:hypothetical protein